MADQGDYERRFLGFPRDLFGFLRERQRPRTPVHVRRIAHPVRWVKWRRQVHRLGPYAPDFDDSDGHPAS